MTSQLIRKDLLYPELSYQIIAVLFEVNNTFGHKYQERYYEKAIAASFSKCGMKFQEQVPIHLVVGNQKIAKGIIDFLIEDKVIVEIKKGERFLKQNIDQLYSYLRMADLELGILANFTSRGLQFRRIVNIRNS